jgi:hypothetical protein
VLAAVLLARNRTGVAGGGGLLLGAGGVWVVVLAHAIEQCATENALADTECGMPDVTPYVVAAVIVAVLGLGLSTFAALRERR